MDTHESIFAWPLTLIETSRPLRAKLELFKYKGSHFSDDFPMIDTFLFSRKITSIHKIFNMFVPNNF